MRICFLCNEYPPGPHGGIGTMTQLLGRALVRSGHAVRVVGAYPAGFPNRPGEIDEGVRVWRSGEGTSRPGKARSRWRLFRAVARWSRDGEIDVVEVPDWEGWAAGWPRLPVPVVARLNGTTRYFAAEMGERAPRLTSALERASLSRADAWCAASRYVAERTGSLFGLPLAGVAILHNAVELRPPPPEAGRLAGRVVFTGRLTAKKGVEPLVRAWPLVLARVPDAELHLFGRDAPSGRNGSMRAFLESIVADRPDPRVVFHGHVDRDAIATALEGASVAVFPSFAEAFAFAPMEAMAAGCPTISSRRGSGPELVVDGRDGLLVDPAEPRQIADAIVRLLADGGLRRRLGMAGRRRIEESFSLPGLVRGSEAFYRDAIERFRGPGASAGDGGRSRTEGGSG
ncbi:MAG TPA: glycosyltransferase family 4 protein [Gemmatimonadota bacterium]|nr:glycosyltransferase family 4 protein [Gemmatimonadota bacterium]